MVERERAERDLHAPTSSSSPAAPPTPPSCCSPPPATSIPTASPTARTRSGGTTCSTPARRCWRSPRSRTRPCSRRRSGVNDYYFAAKEWEFPMGNIQMVGKSSRRDVSAGRSRSMTQARADVRRSRRSRPTRSTSGSRPRTCRGRRTASRSTATAARRSPTRPATRSRSERLFEQLRSMLGHLGMHAQPPDPALRLHEEQDPRRGRRPPGRDLPLRHRPRHVGSRHRTAARTSSTTSTSSTRASSRASRRSTPR